MKYLRKTNTRTLPLIIMVLASFYFAAGQTSFEVSATETQAHQLQHVDPIYPALAKAARIQGDVVLQLEIDPHGQVTNAKALSGPSMLSGAALSAARKWQYKPFERNGSPVSVSINVIVQFTLSSPAKSKR